MCRAFLAGEKKGAGQTGAETRELESSFAPPETPRKRGGFRTAVFKKLRSERYIGTRFGLELSPPWKGVPEVLVVIIGALFLFLLVLCCCEHKRSC